MDISLGVEVEPIVTVSFKVQESILSLFIYMCGDRYIHIYIELAYAKRLSYFAFLNMNMGGGKDGRGVGGCGVHLSLRMHQEYTFKYRSSCRTPAKI